MKISVRFFILFIFMKSKFCLGDLIGFNRLGNNVQFHLQSREFFDFNNGEKIFQEIKALMKKRFPKKGRKSSESRRFKHYVNFMSKSKLH